MGVGYPLVGGTGAKGRRPPSVAPLTELGMS
jgi:hypothetical protein